MAKIDKTNLTKQEWQKIKLARRQQKEKIKLQTETFELKNPANKNYIVCLKHGHKYDCTYVNTLYNMVKRNCTIDYEFVCFTENAQGIDPNVRIEPLPLMPDISGWWYKPMFFNSQLSLDGTILFFDLDVIIFKNIDYLFTHAPGKFCILRDFNRYLRPTWQKFNSSVFRLESKSMSYVYDNFVSNPKTIIRKFHGDQDWIYDQVKTNYEYWPDEWIQSYKWEMRGKPQMVRDHRGGRNFASPGTPKILPKTSVAVFHGEPNPHNCIDQWAIDNWK